MNQLIFERSKSLKESLSDQHIHLAVAESCTGGWLAKSITDHAGSSEMFDCGLVTYSNKAKQTQLGVSPDSLSRYGAVSEEVASEMVEGLFRVTDAELALSITGIAGPDGGGEHKPPGTVWFGWGWRGEAPSTECLHFSGDRAAVRRQAVEWALSTLLRSAGG